MKGGALMYITLEELLQYSFVIIGVIGLIVAVKKK